MHFFNKQLYSRQACYHLDPRLVTPPQAEVACGKLGGRLASFASQDEIDLITSTIPRTEMWIGTFLNNLKLFPINFTSFSLSKGTNGLGLNLKR